MSLLGKGIVFLSLFGTMLLAVASAAKVFPFGEKNNIDQQLQQQQQNGVEIEHQSSSHFYSIYEAKIDHVMEDNRRLDKQLTNLSMNMESMNREIVNQTFSLEKNKINILLLNQEFVAIMNENRNEIERLNKVNENQTLSLIENKLYIKQLNEEFAQIINEKWREVDRLNQLLQSHDRKINACATKDEMEEMSAHFNSILEQIQLNNRMNSALNCGNASVCFQSNDTAYYVLESTAHVTWEEANSACASEGLTLAQPKDEKSTEFVVNELKKTYDLSHDGPWFWIGFRYNADDHQWYWVDGSQIGDYDGDNPVFQTQTDSQCGLIYLYGHLYGDEKWTAHDCAKADQNKYHSLCEKQLI